MKFIKKKWNKIPWREIGSYCVDILFWVFYCAALVGLVYKKEDHEQMDVIERMLNAIGLSQESVTLLMLGLTMVICIVTVVTKHHKIYKFLENHVGSSTAEDGPANQGIRKLLQEMIPKSQVNRIQTDVGLSVNGVQSANQMLHKVSEDIQVVKSQTETINRLQRTSPDVVTASQNAQAAILTLVDEISKQKQENERLTKQISDLTKKLERSQKRIHTLERRTKEVSQQVYEQDDIDLLDWDDPGWER